MNPNGHQKLSLIIACYNERDNIRPVYDRIVGVLDGSGFSLEIIYVDNDSSDESAAVYQELVKRDPRVRVILMSRNFGSPQPSYFAGLQHCAGDAAILIDGDLQDPPEVIPELIKKWKEGYDVVYGIRKKRNEGLISRIAKKIFYRILRRLAYIDIPLDAGEFGLIDRKVVKELARFPENEIYIRGLRAYVGFRQIGVEYERAPRSSGKSNASLLINLKWAKKLITSFSYKPIEWISYFAFLTFLLAVAAGIFYLTLYIINPNSPPGLATVILAMFFLGAVQLLSLSIIGEYLSRIMQEVKNRPRYIIREILGAQDSNSNHFQNKS